MWEPGDKVRLEVDGEVVLATVAVRAEPDEAKRRGGDGFWVKYEQGEREGTAGFHFDRELEPA